MSILLIIYSFWRSMMSLIPPKSNKSSKSPVRNHQGPQSMTVLLTHFFLGYGAKNRQKTPELQIIVIHDVKNYPIFQVSK